MRKVGKKKIFIYSDGSKLYAGMDGGYFVYTGDGEKNAIFKEENTLVDETQIYNCEFCGIYSNGKECIKIKANGAFLYLSNCNHQDGKAASIGVWEINKISSEKRLVLFIPKKEKEEQVFKDFFQNKIIRKDYYTTNSKDLQVEYGMDISNQHYLKLNNQTFYKK